MSEQNNAANSLAKTKWNCKYLIVLTSVLNNTSPVIYRKAKIVYRLDLPYREMCNSNHYSVCTEVQKQSVL